MKSPYQNVRPSILACIARRAACAALAGLLLAGCDADKPAADARPGQALASVDGEEITIMQLNEEMQRAGVPATQQKVASKQLLQALIDRELLESQAAREKIDRDPKVMQAIERARSLIIAQAYMQKALGEAGAPTQAEIEEYFNQHPQFFAERRQLTMSQLILPNAAVTPELRAAADKAKSLDEVAASLEARQVPYDRAQVMRSTADLEPELASKLLANPKGQLFLLQEGPRALLIAIDAVHDAPVSLDLAAPQIAQYLAKRKNKELAQAEIGRLRATARIEYLNKDLAPDPAPPGTPTSAAALAGVAQAAPPAAAPAAGAVAPGVENGVRNGMESGVEKGGLGQVAAKEAPGRGAAVSE